MGKRRALAMAVTLWAAAMAACTGSPPRTSGSPGTPPTGVTSPAPGPSGAIVTPACPVAPAYPDPPLDEPAYTMTVHVDPAASTAFGDLRVGFAPDQPTDRFVFRLWPNAPVQAREGAHLDAGPVTGQDGERLRTEQPDPTTLVVHLGRTARTGQGAAVSMPWRLTVPGPILDRIGGTADEMRLGSFFPILAWVPGTGWADDPPTTTLAEASTSPTADFSVLILAPRGYTVLASGVNVEGIRWHASHVRDFAIAVGRFRTATTLLSMPNPVRVTVGVEQGVFPDPDVILRQILFTLPALERTYGPYPWGAFTMVVTADVGRSGIEYPNFVFEGSQGIERVTTHELAHQWFYSLVGNDQAAEPWLDEALATWAAARHDGYLDYLLHLSMQGVPLDHVGSGMTYWDQHADVYQLGVYVRGVQALASLGPPGMVDCALRSYAATHAYGIATTADLVDALAAVFPDAPGKLARFGIVTRGADAR